MFEDFIRVCGKSSGSNSERKKFAAESTAGPHQDAGDRSARGSTDEGYENSDASPKPTTRSLVLVAESEELCNVKLFFTRQKLSGCPVVHDVRVHAVLDKKAKCKEFLEE